jgi:GNAT superfamily N-acetyltransferase
MNIRAATKSDHDEVMRISRKYIYETMLGDLSDKQIDDVIHALLTDGILLVAEKEDKIRGIIGGRYVEGFMNGKFTEEILWYVEPEYRGVGKQLYSSFEEQCKTNGCVGIAMSAYSVNGFLKVVERFYLQNGYKEIERKYYKTL